MTLPNKNKLDAAFLIPNQKALSDDQQHLISAIGNRNGTPEPKRAYLFDGSDDELHLVTSDIGTLYVSAVLMDGTLDGNISIAYDTDRYKITKPVNEKIFNIKVWTANTATEDHKKSYSYIPSHTWLKGDEGDGSTAYDSSGNGNDWTITNATLSTFHATGSEIPFSWHNSVGFNKPSTTYIPRDESDPTKDVLSNELLNKGKIRQLAKIKNVGVGVFDGDDTKLDLSSHTLKLVIGEEITFKFNINTFVGATNGFHPLVSNGSGSGNRIFLQASGIWSELKNHSEVVAANSITSFTWELNRWYEFKIKYAVDDYLEFYVDGVYIDKSEIFDNGLGFPLNSIGFHSSTYCFDGFMHEVKVDGKIHLILSHGSGDTIYDLTGNGKNGTWVNHTDPLQWGTSDGIIDYNLVNGCELYDDDATHSIQIKIPMNADGSKLTPTISGYSKIKEIPPITLTQHLDADLGLTLDFNAYEALNDSLPSNYLAGDLLPNTALAKSVKGLYAEKILINESENITARQERFVGYDWTPIQLDEPDPFLLIDMPLHDTTRLFKAVNSQSGSGSTEQADSDNDEVGTIVDGGYLGIQWGEVELSGAGTRRPLLSTQAGRSCLKFDGTNDRLMIPEDYASESLKLLEEVWANQYSKWSFQCWYHKDTDAHIDHLFGNLLFTETASNYGFDIFINSSNKLQVRVACGTGTYQIDLTTTKSIVVADGWVPISIIKYGQGANKILVDIDGTVETFTVNAQQGAGASAWALNTGWRNAYADGYLGGLRFWGTDIALSEVEFWKTYNPSRSNEYGGYVTAWDIDLDKQERIFSDTGKTTMIEDGEEIKVILGNSQQNNTFKVTRELVAGSVGADWVKSGQGGLGAANFASGENFDLSDSGLNSSGHGSCTVIIIGKNEDPTYGSHFLADPAGGYVARTGKDYAAQPKPYSVLHYINESQIATIQADDVDRYFIMAYRVEGRNTDGFSIWTEENAKINDTWPTALGFQGQRIGKTGSGISADWDLTGLFSYMRGFRGNVPDDVVKKMVTYYDQLYNIT